MIWPSWHISSFLDFLFSENFEVCRILQFEGYPVKKIQNLSQERISILFIFEILSYNHFCMPKKSQSLFKTYSNVQFQNTMCFLSRCALQIHFYYYRLPDYLCDIKFCPVFSSSLSNSFLKMKLIPQLIDEPQWNKSAAPQRRFKT